MVTERMTYSIPMNDNNGIYLCILIFKAAERAERARTTGAGNKTERHPQLSVQSRTKADVTVKGASPVCLATTPLRPKTLSGVSGPSSASPLPVTSSSHIHSTNHQQVSITSCHLWEHIDKLSKFSIFSCPIDKSK